LVILPKKSLSHDTYRPGDRTNPVNALPRQPVNAIFVRMLRQIDSEETADEP